MSSLGLRTFLPAILFISLTPLHQIWGGALIEAQCPPNPGPHNMPYTGLGPVDGLLCVLVTFFQSNFDNTDALPFSADFLASFATPVALTFIEAARSGCSTLLMFPAILGVLYQIRGAGFTFPLFWLALILSGHARMDRGAARIDQARAEAALFAVAIGFAVPSALLLTMQDPTVTALWQFFPGWMWLAEAGHLFFRPLRNTTRQVTGRNNLALLKDLYVPPILPPDPATINLQLASHVFLQWDAIFTLGSSLLGTLWFASDTKEVALIALWNVFATVVVGPGAAVSGVLLWREWRLNGPPGDVSKKEN
ncbi:hypothetical protein BJV78DRAFT_1164867 [Lactifluus subvellereus]|nr:hypothetical protein BJV78DRAFT_1164867 [Lactifluus subvellereus]